MTSTPTSNPTSLIDPWWDRDLDDMTLGDLAALDRGDADGVRHWASPKRDHGAMGE